MLVGQYESHRKLFLPLGSVVHAKSSLEVCVPKKVRGLDPTPFWYFEDRAYAVQCLVERVEGFERGLQECSEALPDIPNSNRHNVSWVDFSQHYRARLSSYRVKML